MVEQNVKDAFNEAQKKLKEKRIEEYKNIILKTLEKLEEKKKQQQEIVKEIQILKADIEDFKIGRLDRIEERQEKDPLALKVSVVRIEKKETENSPAEKWYYVPYVWSYFTNDGSTWKGEINNSICQHYTTGTYVLFSKTIKHLY